MSGWGISLMATGALFVLILWLACVALKAHGQRYKRIPAKRLDRVCGQYFSPWSDQK